MNNKISKSIETRRFNKKQLQEQFVETYEKLANNVSVACKQVGIGRSTFYQWMEKDQDFAEQIHDIDEGMLDFVESSLTKQIRDGNTTAIIFYLKTKGKKRGYVERTEITGAEEGNNIRIEIVNGNSAN